MDELRDYLPPDQVNVVAYHGSCSDGFGAAYCFWKLFSDSGIDLYDITFIAFSHSTRESEFHDKILPLLENKNVVFVDFIPPQNILFDCLTKPAKVVMLDHHGPVQKTLREFDAKHPGLVEKHIHFDISHSGAILAWDYVFPGMNAPLFLQYIEDRDIWRQPRKFEETDPFVAAFYTAVPFDFEEYNAYLDPATLDNCIAEGRIVLKYQAFEIANIAKRAAERRIVINDKAYHVFIINTNVFFSDLGHYLSQQICKSFGAKCDFVMMWTYDHKSNQVKFSLRSDWTEDNPTCNVAEIAQVFDGNGHPPAAGFTVDYRDVVDDIINQHREEIDNVVNHSEIDNVGDHSEIDNVGENQENAKTIVPEDVMPELEAMVPPSSKSNKAIYVNLLVACGLLGAGALGGHFAPKLLKK